MPATAQDTGPNLQETWPAMTAGDNPGTRRRRNTRSRRLHLATVSDGGNAISRCSQRGRGYVSAAQLREILSLGSSRSIRAHSLLRMSLSFAAARLGQNTEYDKLSIELWTRSITPTTRSVWPQVDQDAHGYFINFEETPTVQLSTAERPPLPATTPLNPRVERV